MAETKDKAIYHLLTEVDQEDGGRSVSEVIDYLVQDWRGLDLPRREIERAVDHCLALGWIKILSEQDCEKDRLRWIDDPHQNWSEDLRRAGCVDFTSAGWDVYAKMAEERLGLGLNGLYSRSIRYLWRVPGRVSMLSVSEEELIREQEEVRSGSDTLVGSGLKAEHTVTDIRGPYAIGPWWVTRFYLAPSGYRMDITFERANMDR